MPNSYASASGGAAGDIYKPQRLQNDPLYNPLAGGVNQAGQTAQAALMQGQNAISGKAQTWNGKGGPTLGSMNVGPNGEVSYQVKSDPFAARLGQLSQMGLVNKSGSQAGPQVQHGGIDEGREASARDAAFARAKDRAGMVARSGIKSLKGIMAARGLQGSTIEGDGVMNEIQGGVGQLGGVLREQAVNEAARAGDIADLEYQGGIQQRGQDIQAEQALLSLINSVGAY